MKTSFYPVLMCNDIQKEEEFFINLLGFQEVFRSEWYISLKDLEGFGFAMIDRTNETIPEQYQKPCEGVILNIEVNDVDSVYENVMNKNRTSSVSEIKNEDYGQRHFMMECSWLIKK